MNTEQKPFLAQPATPPLTSGPYCVDMNLMIERCHALACRVVAGNTNPKHLWSEAAALIGTLEMHGPAYAVANGLNWERPKAETLPWNRPLPSIGDGKDGERLWHPMSEEVKDLMEEVLVVHDGTYSIGFKRDIGAMKWTKGAAWCYRKDLVAHAAMSAHSPQAGREEK